MVDLTDINIEEFDGVLVMEGVSPCLESGRVAAMGSGSGDARSAKTTIQPQADRGAYSQYLGYQDPRLFASWSFGRQLQSQLSSIGTGYSAEVSDFGRYVSAKVTYSSPPTGKSASKTFLIVFEPDGRTGDIFQTSNHYRTFSGIGQAASYIKSCVSSLRNNMS